MTEYTIVSAGRPNELITEVNQRIKDGWTPLGGVCAYVVDATKSYLDMGYCQALVKLEQGGTRD
jgi:hypothetical protein